MASILNVNKIRANGSTTDALTVDSSGRVLQPAKPAFSCRPSAPISRTTSGWQTLDFDTVDFDIGSDLHADGYFTCPVAGVYHFDYRVRFDSIGTGFLIICLASVTSGVPSSSDSVYLNSYVIDGTPPSNYQSLMTSTNLKLAVGDNVCLLYTSPSPRDATLSRMPSSA